MHVLVGMADIASSTLLLWENAHFESVVGAAAAIGGYTKSESGIVRLIWTTCKAMGRHESEQSGVYQPFTTFLKANNISRNPLAPFRGNRFNILLYDAGVIYLSSSLIKKFLIEVWQTPNKLLRTVLVDVQVPEFIAGCKALGLVNKLITGPLWRVIESKDLSILDMNCRYQLLVDCLEKWPGLVMLLQLFHVKPFSLMISRLLMIKSLVLCVHLVNMTPQCKRYSRFFFVLFRLYFIGS